MATRSSIFAQKVPWREELGRLQSMGLQKVRHNWVCAHTHTHTHTCKALFKAGVPSFVWQVGKQRLREGNKLILQTRVTNSFNCEWENSGRILKSQRFYPEISSRTGPRLVISKL